MTLYLRFPPSSSPSPFSPLFRRSQSRHSLERYITGLLTDLDRKNCDTIAAAVAGTSTERLQHLLTDADWNSLELDGARVRSLSQKSPKGGGILVLDDTSFPKQGKSSVGVARQYCGALGKRANCQVVVSAEYVAEEPESSRPLHWPVCAQLYLPQSWAKDRQLRERAHIPAEVHFRIKSQIALSLVDLSGEWGVPFEVVVADSGYGKYPTFLEGLEERKLTLTYAGWRAPSGCACLRRLWLLRRPERHHTGGGDSLPRSAPLLFTRPR